MCDCVTVCLFVSGGFGHMRPRCTPVVFNLLWWVYVAVTIAHISNIILLSSTEFLLD